VDSDTVITAQVSVEPKHYFHLFKINITPFSAIRGINTLHCGIIQLINDYKIGLVIVVVGVGK
jgi:hypothetical protein